ncbi:PREDICTED: exosome complex component CSL4 isoform X4 [Nanorana parkeri]|uniref:exosome complex component CSL4 isoform X4 n=1 Tax=Nanorana parkeri TaxID=125878 RepID=UPI000854B94D|nr:PREDICTED: exosome complex component CSL4 isoform X4 [Nanorana parkeri]
MAPVRWCVPGERLCSLEDCAPGHGTYCKHGYIFASLAGYVFKTSDNGLVEVYKCVRPGDIVIGKVISLGDSQSSYLLSTAENELGVVVAHSEAGATMVPISWCEMQCPKTHIKEPRKVARVQPEFLQT